MASENRDALPSQLSFGDILIQWLKQEKSFHPNSIVFNLQTPLFSKLSQHGEALSHLDEFSEYLQNVVCLVDLIRKASKHPPLCRALVDIFALTTERQVLCGEDLPLCRLDIQDLSVDNDGGVFTFNMEETGGWNHEYSFRFLYQGTTERFRLANLSRRDTWGGNDFFEYVVDEDDRRCQLEWNQVRSHVRRLFVASEEELNKFLFLPDEMSHEK